MELLHFSHHHPLILHKELKESDDHEMACYGCDKPIKGPYYRCRDCSHFMHNSCAELPREMQHWLHAKHPLTLIDKQPRRCNACAHPIRNLLYNCSLCDFNLDLRCVSLPRTIEHCGHEHPFTLLAKQSRFLCDACGAEGDGMSYLCTYCQFWVHLQCASLPCIINLSDHIHPLALTFSLKGNYSRDCRLCHGEVKTDHGFYHCADCNYLAHVGCTTSKENNARKLMRERGKVRDRLFVREREAELVDPRASLPANIVHCGHEHPLSLMVNNTKFHCDACATQVEGSFSYICTTCGLWVHSECALLPKSIKMTVHDHLFSLATSFKLDNCNVCLLCNEKVNPSYWVYYCPEGDNFAHVHCAKEVLRNAGITLLPHDGHQEDPDSYFLPVMHETIDLITEIDVEGSTTLGEEEVARELKHFSHPHCLNLSEAMENDEKCHGCAEPLSGPAYTCANCRYFLHKSCAGLPREILKHPLHPQHPLGLFVNPPFPHAYCLCSACGHSVTHFVYHCSLCEFNLDLRCVSLPCTIRHHGHEHPLNLLQKPAKFACYACGTEGDGNSYLCATCLVLFHLDCASSPKTFKLNSHNHSLRLCFTPDNIQTNEYSCVVCDAIMKLDRWYYFCEELYCNCAAHLHCATSTKRPSRNSSVLDDDVALDPMPIPDESIFLTTDDDHKNHRVEETLPVQLSHFSHQHCLKLCNELKTGEKCNGCTQPICGLFYSCSECNFFLHKSCTQLRDEIRHPFHLEHRLKLSAKGPNSDGFWCEMCGIECNGFGYRCDYCNFVIDIVCSSILSGNLKHDAHEHVLTLSGNAEQIDFCRACLGSSRCRRIMRCSDCNFNLHVYCATLPRTVWHKIHRHPFTLTYLSVEDDSDEYYCDICEEERDPRHWFYNCAECDYPAHVSCMVGSHHRIK